MFSISSFMLAFSVSSIFAFNLKSFVTILSHLSHVFISTLTCSSCLPMYPETLKPCLHIYSDILKSCLHIHTDTLKACPYPVADLALAWGSGPLPRAHLVS